MDNMLDFDVCDIIPPDRIFWYTRMLATEVQI